MVSLEVQSMRALGMFTIIRRYHMLSDPRGSIFMNAACSDPVRHVTVTVTDCEDCGIRRDRSSPIEFIRPAALEK